MSITPPCPALLGRFSRRLHTYDYRTHYVHMHLSTIRRPSKSQGVGVREKGGSRETSKDPRQGLHGLPPRNKNSGRREGALKVRELKRGPQAGSANETLLAFPGTCVTSQTAKPYRPSPQKHSHSGMSHNVAFSCHSCLVVPLSHRSRSRFPGP